MMHERLHEEKQPVHEQWWFISLFAAVMPLGLSFAFRMAPLGEYIKQDPQWSPGLVDKDVDLLDITTAVPSVIVPMLVGIAIDSSWSVNLGLLLCLTGSVVAEFLVALGFSWHSYGWLLSGRLLLGVCVGSSYVVADTIAAQFNRKRRATTFGLIASLQTLAVGAGMGSQISDFTRDSLQGDYTKMNDVFLIVTLMCLGVGFLWTPIVNSYEMQDSSKRRFWKWHVPLAIWGLALTQLLYMLSHAGPSTGAETVGIEVLSLVFVGPLLGYYLDKTGKSQGGSLTVARMLVAMTALVAIGGLTRSTWISGLAVGTIPMLSRTVVPQVASRDSLSTSFGLVEGAMFLGWIMYSKVELSWLGEFLCVVFNILFFVYITNRVGHKWEQLRLPELAEPLHGRGG